MRPGPAPPFCTSTAPTINILPWWLRPPPPVTGSFLLRQGISVSSISTKPASAVRPGATILWIGGPEPSGQRQLGVVHDRPGGHRGLTTAAGAFPCPRFGLQFPCLARAAAGADEALRPARRKEILGARLFIRKTLLELDQRAGKIAHGSLPKRAHVRYLFYPYSLAVPPLIALPETGIRLLA